MEKTIGMISLGCDKNRVDAENILFSLQSSGYKIINDSEEAEFLIINTCAFIDTAKKESIDTILEFANLKKANQKIIVTGCLAERYGNDVVNDLPEVDLFVGINSYHEIAKLIENIDKNNKVVKSTIATEYIKGRVLTTPYHYAYLKIADGCDNRCAYCAIPFIRGNYRSEKIETLVAEAKSLITDGVKELILVAQDTTRYGIDLYHKHSLLTLLKELVKLDIEKIRLMYVYPELLSEELVQFISDNDKMAKYIDMPLQHIDDKILNLMNRRNTGDEAKAKIAMIKKIDSRISIRSGFIVGFPGEDEEAFENLKEFIATAPIDYAGFFAYSKEENTKAYEYKETVGVREKKKRVKQLEKIQCAKLIDIHQKYSGKCVDVVYEGLDYDKNCFVGRTENNAPDIDTKVFFTSDEVLQIGQTYKVIITHADFHLSGKTFKTSV